MSLPEITSEMLRMLYEALGEKFAKLLIQSFVFFALMMALSTLVSNFIALFGSIKVLEPYGENIAAITASILLVGFFVFPNSVDVVLGSSKFWAWS